MRSTESIQEFDQWVHENHEILLLLCYNAPLVCEWLVGLDHFIRLGFVHFV